MLYHEYQEFQKRKLTKTAEKTGEKTWIQNKYSIPNWVEINSRRELLKLQYLRSNARNQIKIRIQINLKGDSYEKETIIESLNFVLEKFVRCSELQINLQKCELENVDFIKLINSLKGDEDRTQLIDLKLA